MYAIDKNLMPSPPLVSRKEEAFTLPHIISWLEAQDPAQSYNWSNCEGACLFAQYGFACGLTGDETEVYNATMPRVGMAIHTAGIACKLPHTFGAALSRARSYQQAVTT